MADPDRVVARARAAVAREGLWRAGDRLIVAVSGGADSVCLLDVLRRLGGAAAPVPLVVHVDHGFRADSADDAAFVRRLAEELGVAYEVARADGPAYARAHRLGLEQAGRALRYRALAAAAARHGARAVATGHTGDDSVESVLLHLLRGAGTEGLGGIAPIEQLDVGRLGPVAGDGAPPSATVVRPLLELRRAETAAYCAARGLAWRADPTNDDPTFLRNRVRHHLLPVLRTYNPAIDAALHRTARVIREDDAWLDVLVARRWDRLVSAGPDRVEISRAAWRRQPRAARRRLVRRAAAHLGVSGDGLGFEAVERALAFATAAGPGRTRLAGHLAIRRTGDCLQFGREDGPA